MDNLSCGVCFSHYCSHSFCSTYPCLLQCGHTYCTGCISEIKKRSSDSALCPTCKRLLKQTSSPCYTLLDVIGDSDIKTCEGSEVTLSGEFFTLTPEIITNVSPSLCDRCLSLVLDDNYLDKGFVKGETKKVDQAFFCTVCADKIRDKLSEVVPVKSSSPPTRDIESDLQVTLVIVRSTIDTMTFISTESLTSLLVDFPQWICSTCLPIGLETAYDEEITFCLPCSRGLLKTYGFTVKLPPFSSSRDVVDLVKHDSMESSSSQRFEYQLNAMERKQLELEKDALREKPRGRDLYCCRYCDLNSTISPPFLASTDTRQSFERDRFLHLQCQFEELLNGQEAYLRWKVPETSTRYSYCPRQDACKECFACLEANFKRLYSIRDIDSMPRCSQKEKWLLPNPWAWQKGFCDKSNQCSNCRTNVATCVGMSHKDLVQCMGSDPRGRCEDDSKPESSDTKWQIDKSTTSWSYCNTDCPCRICAYKLANFGGILLEGENNYLFQSDGKTMLDAEPTGDFTKTWAEWCKEQRCNFFLCRYDPVLSSSSFSSCGECNGEGSWNEQECGECDGRGYFSPINKHSSSSSSSRETSSKTFKCSACGITGHKKNNRSCILYRKECKCTYVNPCEKCIERGFFRRSALKNICGACGKIGHYRNDKKCLHSQKKRCIE